MSALHGSELIIRDYVSMLGLQAFYPSGETLQRERSPLGLPRGLDFVPLEIFLDVRSEATDYDRIVLKTDTAVSFDRFNHLRTARGLEWPEVHDNDGEAVRHLRIHQVSILRRRSSNISGFDHCHRSARHHVRYFQALHSIIQRGHRSPHVSRSRPPSPL